MNAKKDERVKSKGNVILTWEEDKMRKELRKLLKRRRKMEREQLGANDQQEWKEGRERKRFREFHLTLGR